MDFFRLRPVPKYRFLHFFQKNLQKIFVFIFFFSLQKSKIRLCSFGERAVPAEQPFKILKRRRQQFCRRRLRPSVNHTLFYSIFFLSAINCGSHYAYAGNKEDCNPKSHHAVVAGLRTIRCSCIRVTFRRLNRFFRL